MGQKVSRSIPKQAPVIHFLITMPNELLRIILLLMNVKSQLALARTCKQLYKRCENPLMTVLHSSLMSLSDYDDSIKALRLLPKFLNDEFPKKVLCSDETLTVPEKLNPTSVDGLIIISSEEKCIPNNLFFLENFPI